VYVSATFAAEIVQMVTYEVIFQVCMHIIDSVVHDSCSDALASEAQRPRWFHVQIELWYSTSLTSIVLRTTAQEAQLLQRKRASNIALSYGAKGISIC